MSPTLTAAVISACLLGAVFLGVSLRRLLPDHHLSADTRDTVKLAMGLVATMSALLLGLLVSSAKGAYDNTRGQVIQMAAKVAFLDRILTVYGPDAAGARSQFHAAVEKVIGSMWPRTGAPPAAPRADTQMGDVAFAAIQNLLPQDDTQRDLKVRAVNAAVELGQLRALLLAQSVPSISRPLLVMVVAWLLVIFFSFSLLAPANATAKLALMVSALSVAGAMFLILELDHPFGGLIQIPSEPMENALSLLTKSGP